MHNKIISFATGNSGKVKYVQKVLSNYDIKVDHIDLELIEPRSNDLEEIAAAKVKQAFSKIKKPCIAIDSGFYISEFNGFPGTYVNFTLNTIGIDGILRLVGKSERNCCFKNCLAYYDDKLDEPVFFNSKVNGQLSMTKRGRMQDYSWSELFLLFIPENETMTLGEMDRDYFDQWRKENRKNSSAELFPRWYSKHMTSGL